jgi:hypothetical protein
MKHHVFKDLAPAYIDGLTSKETSKEMEKHMDQCEECQNYLNEMKDDLFQEDEIERKKDTRNIDYFKKVRTKNRKKILVIVSSLLSLFLILTTIYYFMFVDMRLADADNVETNIQNKDMSVTLSFKAKRGNRYLLTNEEWDVNAEYIGYIYIYEMRDDFTSSAKLLKDGVSTTYTFLDENTLLLDNGDKRKLTDEDKVHIQYKDSTEEILLKDLYDAEDNN